MTSILVVSDKHMEGVDGARVWSFVADPANLDDWAPAHHAGYLGTELPGVGHTIFLYRSRTTKPDAAWRCRIEAWEAGRSVRCSLETPGWAEAQEIEVAVGTEGTGASPAASVRLSYRGDVPPRLTAVYRWRIGALQRQAIDRIFRAVTAG